jgi:hypothetical protein
MLMVNGKWEWSSFPRGLMAEGGHGFPNVSHGPAMLHLSTPRGRGTGEMAMWGGPSGVVHLQGRQPAAVFYPFGHPTPYAWFSPYAGRWRISVRFLRLGMGSSLRDRGRSEGVGRGASMDSLRYH